MKKSLILLVLGVAMTSGVFAATQFRLEGLLSTGLAEAPTKETVYAAFQDKSSLFSGLQLEVIFDRLGLGTEMSVNFRDSGTQWMVNWRGELFLSYHFFRGGAFLDPFIEIGFGNAGGVDISNGVKKNAQSGLIDGLSLSLFPRAAAGLAVDLDGLVIGAKASFTPVNARIPAAPILAFPLKEFQFGLFAGIAFGGHDRGPVSDARFKAPKVRIEIDPDQSEED